jgi:hypothetical protein
MKSRTLRAWLAVFDGERWHPVREWQGQRPGRSPLTLCREQLARCTDRLPDGSYAVTRARCVIEGTDGSSVTVEIGRGR